MVGVEGRWVCLGPRSSPLVVPLPAFSWLSRSFSEKNPRWIFERILCSFVIMELWFFWLVGWVQVVLGVEV